MRAEIKYALIPIGSVLLAVVVILTVMLITYDRRTPDEFIKVWKNAVERGDVKLYESLWDETARRKREPHFKEATELMKNNKLEINLDEIEKKGNDKRMMFSGISVKIHRKDGSVAETKKRLIIARRGFSRRWRVIDEESYISAIAPVVRKPKVRGKHGTEKPPTAKVERGTPLDTELKLRQIIEDWRQAWEKKDVDRYIGKYADFAEIRRVTVVNGKEYPVKLTKEELRRRMRRLWKRYGRIKVNISTLQIKGDYATADVNFLQEYKAWVADNKRIAYQDFGTKQLKFVRDVKDNTWKIISENWKIYKKVPSYPKL